MKKTILTMVLVIMATFYLKPSKVVSITVENQPVVELTAEEHIEKIFGKDAKVAKAVILHESQNNLRAVGYNCHYYKKDGTRYSTSCKKGDRPNAWSVDCGIGQINFKGTTCPERLLTLEGNMKAIELKYKEQGLGAWVSYNTGAYKQYL